MATHSANVAATNASAAEFRAWINFVHDMMIAAGWNQTADTGQINFATVGAPGAANTKQGYALYEMTDSLAATFPIIVKFAFGSGSAAANPGIWFMVGTHTDGAGNFIDPDDGNRAAYLLNQYTQAAPAIAVTTANADAARPSFGSGDGGRVVFVLFEMKPIIRDASPVLGTNVPQTFATDSPNNITQLFSIERARNWDGNYIGSHVAMIWSANPGIPNRTIYFESQHGYVLLDPITGLPNAIGTGPGTTTAAGVVTQGYSGTPLEVGTKYEPEDLGVIAPASPPIHHLRNSLQVPPGINVQVSRWSRFQWNPWPPPDWQNPPNPTASDSSYVTGTTIGLSPYGTARIYRTVAGLRAPQSVSTPTTIYPTFWIYILYE